jgi:hypothetical protein
MTRRLKLNRTTPGHIAFAARLARAKDRIFL